jgi:uncharacterized protein (DUF58 family)
MKFLAPSHERGRVANFAAEFVERLQNRSLKSGRAAKKKTLSYGLEERDLVPGLPPLLPHYDGRYWVSVNKTGLVKCWQFWAQGLTAGGRWLSGASLAFFTVGSTSLDLQVFVPLCYVTALWASALLARLFLRPRATLEARFATRVGSHEPLPVSVRVACTGKYLSRAHVVADRLPPHFEVRPAQGVEIPPLSRGESARLAFEMVPTKRGAWSIRGLRIESDAPFGLLNAARIFPLNVCVLVHPMFTPLRQFELPTGRAHQPGGVALASSRGDTMEFWGNREWRQGDRLRDIDWRATARLRRPLERAIVREYREEWLARVGVILDTHAPDAKSEADFERAVSVGAAVGDFLARSDYMVDIFAAGPELFSLSAGRSLAYLDQILDILARVEASDAGGWQQLGGALDEYMAQVTTLVCVMLDWDEERRAFALRLVQEGAAVRVILVRDREPTLHPDADADWLGLTPIVTQAIFENGVHDL